MDGVTMMMMYTCDRRPCAVREYHRITYRANRLLLLLSASSGSLLTAIISTFVTS